MENYSNGTSYLTFLLNQELYAYKVSEVIEVIELQKVTIIPKTPPYIMGVINFRGEILPLIDVRKKCGLNATAEFNADNSVLIVLEINKEDPDNKLTVVSIVNNVSDVVDVKPIDIMPIPDFDTKIKTEYTEGIFKHKDNFITILDTSAIFSLNNNIKK